MELSSLIKPDLVFPNLPGRDAGGVLLALAMKLAESGAVRDAGDLYRRLEERERLGSTAMGRGVAIPHCKLDELDEVLVGIATSAEGVDFGAPDGEPVRVFFIVLSPSGKSVDHLQSLAAISRWVTGVESLDLLLESDDASGILALLGHEKVTE